VGGRAGRPGGDFAPRKFAGKPTGKAAGFGAKGGGKFGAKAGGGFGAKTGGKPRSKSSRGPAAGGFGDKKPFGKTGKPFGKSSKPFVGKPAGTFAKFAGGKKPFGERPPARKFKPKEGESA
jgi:hypothetical protein